MANIEVNLQKLEAAAAAIEAFVSKTKRNMARIDHSVASLETAWKGNDYDQIKREWNEINASGSTSDKMLDSLENYAGALRDAAAKYKKAQARAINRANVLCK